MKPSEHPFNPPNHAQLISANRKLIKDSLQPLPSVPQKAGGQAKRRRRPINQQQHVFDHCAMLGSRSEFAWSQFFVAPSALFYDPETPSITPIPNQTFSRCVKKKHKTTLGLKLYSQGGGASQLPSVRQRRVELVSSPMTPQTSSHRNRSRRESELVICRGV